VSGVAKPVVLVVDDEPSIRLLCKVNLELAGYEVREAGTLEDAWAALDGDEIAVVLLDMHVGNERSDPLLAELRDRGLPVAVVTGSADLDPLRDAADAVLGKPFTIADLESVVAELASRPGR
jgi:DNA-binding NtrC family response regulator